MRKEICRLGRLRRRIGVGLLNAKGMERCEWEIRRDREMIEGMRNL